MVDVQKSVQFEVVTNLGAFNRRFGGYCNRRASFPKLGATDFGYRLAEKFDLKLVSRVAPGLCRLTFGNRTNVSIRNSGGISLDVIATVSGAKFRENILFTHRGVSGPAIFTNFQLSLSDRSDLPSISFPEKSAKQSLLESHRSEKKGADDGFKPKVATAFCAGMVRTKCAIPSDESFHAAANWNPSRRVCIHGKSDRAGDEGYAKAEVTLGGIETNEFSSKTMEARRVPGLYFIGEVVDVTGWLGGYNFQWAWASGFAAGQAV